MRIHFEITIDDVIARRQIEFFNSTFWRWGISTPVSVAFCLLIQVALLALSIKFNFQLIFIVIFVASVVGWSFAFSKIAAWVHARRIRRTLRGPAGRFALGECTMELRDWSLIVTTELMQIAFDFRAIESVFFLPKHALVRVGSRTLFFIPLDRFPEQEFRSFVAELREYWENRHSGPPMVLRALRLPPLVDERIKELA